MMNTRKKLKKIISLDPGKTNSNFLGIFSLSRTQINGFGPGAKEISI